MTLHKNIVRMCKFISSKKMKNWSFSRKEENQGCERGRFLHFKSYFLLFDNVCLLKETSYLFSSCSGYFFFHLLDTFPCTETSGHLHDWSDTCAPDHIHNPHPHLGSHLLFECHSQPYPLPTPLGQLSPGLQGYVRPPNTEKRREIRRNVAVQSLQPSQRRTNCSG